MTGCFDKVDECAHDTGFSGVISVSQKGASIFESCYGYRDRAERLPNEGNTRFAIASGTKLFTALAIGRLVEQGKLSLSTRIGDLSGDFSGFIDPAATIDQLLSHTSGIFDYLDEETMDDYDNFRVEIPWCYLETPGDYLPVFKGKAMKFKPGERFSYSNGGYVLLGIVIEMLSQRAYRDFVQDEVLARAGMDRSGFFAFNDLPPNTAKGYLESASENAYATNIYKVPIRGGGDGGMYTTAPDLLALWSNLFAARILGKEMTDRFLSHVVDIDIDAGIAYGRGIYIDRKHDGFFIEGGDHGVGFDSRHLPGSGLTASILANQSECEEELRDLMIEVLA